MQYPTIHLNGSSPETLAEGYRTVRYALEGAYNALSATAPHGRDYYPQGPDALRAATGEHAERLRAIEALIVQISKLEEHCRDAAEARTYTRS